MNSDNDWDDPRSRDWRAVDAGMGMLRITLLFGSAAVALALIIAPIAEERARSIAGVPAAGLDMTSTGSVGGGYHGGYTIRRSVLQPSPNSICIIRDNGTRSGNC